MLRKKSAELALTVVVPVLNEEILLPSFLAKIGRIRDWQALFNFDVHTPLVAQGSESRYGRHYSNMLPLLTPLYAESVHTSA